jgi:hypothetical protein
MVIDQRNAGASVTPTSDGTYTLDRWKTSLTQSSKFSVQQQTSVVPDGFTYALKVTSLSAFSVGSGDTLAFIKYLKVLILQICLGVLQMQKPLRCRFMFTLA